MNVRRVAGSVCTLALISTAGVVVTQSAGAAEALDQQQSVAGSTDLVDADNSFAQTFTAGRTGPLTRVDLRLFRAEETSDPLTVEIRNASAAGPGSTVLATAVVPAGSVSADEVGTETVTFAAPASVTAGSTYALAVHTNGSAQQFWVGTSATNTYAAGDAWFAPTSPPSGPWASQSYDLTFATYVDGPLGPKPTPAPKPKLKAECSFTISAKERKKYNVIKGTNGDDRIVGTIRGGGGNDIICGGAGADQIYGGGGNDKISGGPGTDLVVGNKGNDVLRGDKANDVLKGGAGNDVLRGGAGHDIVQGGSGRDDERQ
ncbi:calcium-binding protein [Sporichthya brevicatena]